MTAVRNAMNEAGSISVLRSSLAGFQRMKREESERSGMMARKMRTKRICKICGKEFTPNCNIQKTCSNECRKKNAYALNRKWRLNHPEYKSRYDYSLYEKNYKPEGRCKICGGVIIQEKLYGRRRNAQMHQQCIINECVKMLSETSRLDNMRRQRLAQIGYTMEEFRNEYGLQDKRYRRFQKT